MRRLLILSLVCWCSTASLLYAQVPQQTSVEGKVIFTPRQPGQAEFVCNSAGTFLIGQPGVTTQSNDLALPVIYLCKGDSVFINHNGDADLSGDPIPATAPGVGWAIYRNMPTIGGDSLYQVVTPNMLTGTNGLPRLAFGEPDGDIWFRNFCYLQDSFNNSLPGKFFFAPITVDNFSTTNTWESAQVGFPPGPCVNVNIADAFEVVYLNPIVIEGVNTANGNDCVGSFVVKGGLPQYDKDEHYTIDIYLTADPTVKALIYTSVPSYQHGNPINFSVKQSGEYTIVIEDGRSCGFRGTINMAGCNPADNLILNFPDTLVPPGTKICIPIKVDNFTNLVTNTFTVEWDETVLQYSNYQNVSPSVFFNPVNNVNEAFTGIGKLGFIFFRSTGAAMGNIPAGGTLVNVCFTALGDLGECSPLTVTNDPSAVSAENANGFVGMTIDTGSICIGFLPLKMDLAIIKPTCTGQATLQAVPSGGHAPYDIAWNALTGGGSPGSGNLTVEGDTLEGLLTKNGIYEVCVTDQEGASFCDTIEMKIPILGANVTFEQPKCFGDSTGTVTANVLIDGIAAPDPSLFKYDWDPVGLTTQNIPVQTNMPAGAYSVTVTELLTGCFQVASGTMGSPAPVSDQLVDIMAASCNGIEDGTVSYIAEGGTPFPGTAYTYEWAYSSTANGTFTPFLTVTENPSVLNSRANGYYRVTITDANGCTFTDDLQIGTQRTITINVGTVKGPNCVGGADGSISIAMSETPALPGADYAFIWVQMGGIENSTATTSTLSGLKAGTYGITAIENSGCADTATITITDPPKLVLDTVDLKNPTCVQPTSGAITVSVNGGTPASANVYSMFWSAPLPSGNSIYAQSALSAGTYSVTAVDSKGCRDSLMLTLNLPPAPVIQNVVTTPVKCGSDGCLEVVTNATGPTFSWQQLDSTAILATTAKVCSLDGGQYVITLKDANSCVTVDTFSLTPVIPLSIDTATLNIPKCFGDANGSIIPTISGGQPTYKYAWNTVPPSSQPALNLIKAGQYTLTVTDLKGCTEVETFDLPNPPSINAYYSDAKPATCSDTCNGAASIVVNYSNGTPGDFLFQWSGTPASTASVRTDLCPGMYTVTVVATINSCSRLVDVLVGSPQPISATALDSVSVTCNGDNDGEASIAVTGGTSPYKFVWSTGGQTNTVKNLEAGPYAVTVTDKNNCKKVFSLTVPEPTPVVVTSSLVDQPKCFGNADGTLGVDATGGNPGTYTYAWVKEPSQTSLGTGSTVNSLPAGYYSVTVTDPKGCTGSLDSILLSDPAPVLGSIDGYEPLKCYGDQTLITVANVSGGSGAPYYYSVDNGATLPIDVPFTIDGGEHVITYSDRQNCEFSDTITIPEPAEITVKFVPEEVEIQLGDSLLLNPIVTGAAITNIVWTPADALSNPDTLTPYAKPYRSVMLTLTVSDSNNCSGTGKITILIDPNRNVYMPNVFKAGNPAGTNNAFNAWVGPGVKDINYFQVYDRWGELLYERTNFLPDNDNLEEGWDGRYKGDFVNPGVYIYVLEVDFLDGRTLLYRGDVTVVR